MNLNVERNLIISSLLTTKSLLPVNQSHASKFHCLCIILTHLGQNICLIGLAFVGIKQACIVNSLNSNKIIALQPAVHVY